MEPNFREQEEGYNDDSSDEVDDTPSDSEEVSEDPQITPPEPSWASSTEPPAKRHITEQLFVAHDEDTHEDDALACGDYHPRSEGVWEDRLAGNVADTCQRLKDMLTFPLAEQSRQRNELCGEYRLQDLIVPNLDSHTTARPSLPSSHSEAAFLDDPWAASPSPKEFTEASAYYTPLSVGEQIEQTFQRHRRPSHPDLVGRRNVHPYQGPLLRVADDPWNFAAFPIPATVLLRNVDPQPLDDFE